MLMDHNPFAFPFMSRSFISTFVLARSLAELIDCTGQVKRLPRSTKDSDKSQNTQRMYWMNEWLNDVPEELLISHANRLNVQSRQLLWNLPRSAPHSMNDELIRDRIGGWGCCCCCCRAYPNTECFQRSAPHSLTWSMNDDQQQQQQQDL